MNSSLMRKIGSWATRAAVTLTAAIGLAFVFSTPKQVTAAQSEQITVIISPRDTFPPAAVTDLRGTSGAAGQMLLEWTAPDESEAGFTTPYPATSYIIKIATFSVDTIGSTTAWWNGAVDVTGEPPPANPGTTDLMLINGLAQGVTYYAGIKSVDAVGLISPIDTLSSTPGQQAYVVIYGAVAPATPANFTGTVINTTSVRWDWAISLGANAYQLFDDPLGTLVTQTTDLFLVETGLNPNTRVSRTIRAINTVGSSPASAAVTIYTFAATPTGFGLTNAGVTSITLGWNATGNTTGTLYRIERSTDSVVFSTAGTTTALTYQDSSLTENTSYYYRLYAINGAGIETAPTAIVFTRTLNQIPGEPLGLRGILDPTGTAFTLIWEDDTYNADGTVMTDLAGYHVYRRTSLTGARTRLTPTPLNVTVFADQVNNQTLYYTVTALDTRGNESVESLTADSSVDRNIIYVSSDNLSSLLMPATISELLRSANNKYGVPLTIGMNEEAIPTNTSVVRTIRLSLIRGDTKQTLDDLAFAEPQATVAVGYRMDNGSVGRGRPSAQSNAVSASNIVTNAQPEDLSMYWHNGVTWVKIGGTLDKSAQTIATKSSFLGAYSLRIVGRAVSLTLEQANVYPRLFTPNDDGFNDRVYFVLENPNDADVSGEIYDMAGRFVATLPPPQAGTGIGTTLIWDGKDSTGTVVPSGTYVYRIKGEGKTFTGTVAVAR